MRGRSPHASYTAVVDTVHFGCGSKAVEYGCNVSSAGVTTLSSRFALPEDLEGQASAEGGANATVVDPWTGNRMVAHALLLTDLPELWGADEQASLEAALKLATVFFETSRNL